MLASWLAYRLTLAACVLSVECGRVSYMFWYSCVDNGVVNDRRGKTKPRPGVLCTFMVRGSIHKHKIVF